MTRLRFTLLSLLLFVAVSCVQRLPDANDMDHYYKVAEAEMHERIAELEGQRASGAIDEFNYKKERDAINRFISRRAANLAWVSHDLREKALEVRGIPTPDHPQEISVPQAGALPTGSDFRRFNQKDITSPSNNAPLNDLRQLMGTSGNQNEIRAPVKPQVENPVVE